MAARHFRPLSVAILIPSRGRPEILAKTLRRTPELNDQHTFIGIEKKELESYRIVWDQKIGDRCTYLTYNNPEGSVGLAREELRQCAIENGPYDYYIATDDNAKFTIGGVNALVQSAEAWRLKTGKLTFVCGMHSTAMHFDRNLIKRKETVNGWTTYPGIGFIFHCMPHAWYESYAYPESCFALEDRHMMLSAINAGHTEFRVSMDAPFSKSRYQRGGQGDINKRRWNCGRAIEQLAHDFPSDVGARGTLPLPWQFIMQLHGGAEVDRLVGGAMRKGDALVKGKVLRARIRKP